MLTLLLEAHSNAHANLHQMIYEICILALVSLVPNHNSVHFLSFKHHTWILNSQLSCTHWLYIPRHRNVMFSKLGRQFQ